MPTWLLINLFKIQKLVKKIYIFISLYLKWFLSFQTTNEVGMYHSCTMQRLCLFIRQNRWTSVSFWYVVVILKQNVLINSRFWSRTGQYLPNFNALTEGVTEMNIFISEKWNYPKAHSSQSISFLPKLKLQLQLKCSHKNMIQAGSFWNSVQSICSCCLIFDTGF